MPGSRVTEQTARSLRNCAPLQRLREAPLFLWSFCSMGWMVVSARIASVSTPVLMWMPPLLGEVSLPPSHRNM